jgi:uncharacterized protein (TIGR03118 family)
MRAHSKWARVAVLGVVLAVTLLLAVGPASAKGLTQLNLLSDLAGLALHTDASVVNPWGIAFGPTGLLWVSNNGTGVATVYQPDGDSTGIAVTIPLPPGSTAPNAAPTGVVFNDTADFVVTDGVTSEASRFLFATEDGTIAGWAPGVSETDALLAVDNSANGAVYKGIALASDTGENFLYATDFHNGVVDVFGADFAPVGAFTDPDLPADFAPFGIRNLGGMLYVTYAKQLAPDNHDDETGPGNGFVVIFDPQGNVVKELISHGELNSPWGMVILPDGFGKFGRKLIVGNFGDGEMNAYDPASGKFIGKLTDRQGNSLVNDGLWGLEATRQPVDFRASLRAADEDEGIPLLYFAAGLNDEADGLVGTLRQPPAWGRFVRPVPRGRR